MDNVVRYTRTPYEGPRILKNPDVTQVHDWKSTAPAHRGGLLPGRRRRCIPGILTKNLN